MLPNPTKIGGGPLRRKLRTISGNDSSIDFWFQGLMIAPASIPRGGKGAVDLSKKNPTTSMCDSQSFGFGTRCLDHILAKGTYGTTGKRRRIGREVETEEEEWGDLVGVEKIPSMLTPPDGWDSQSIFSKVVDERFERDPEHPLNQLQRGRDQGGTRGRGIT